MTKRILVVGNCGSGKSYLSSRLGQTLGIPVIHLDRIFWREGWQSLPREEFDRRLDEIMQGKSWIIDGDYGRTMEERFLHADGVIFLDVNRWVCFFSVVRRCGKARSDMPDGCNERWNTEYIDFLLKVLQYPKKGKQRVLALHEKYPHLPFKVLKSRREINDFIRRAENEADILER